MLKILYGAAGTGKSTAVMDEIKKNAECGKRSLAVVPNQFTFEYERMLYDHLGAKLYNSGLVTVLSPERLVYDIFSSVSSPELSAADLTVKTAVMYMTVKKIADDKKEGFLYF